MEGKKGSKFNYDDYAVKIDKNTPFVETINERSCKRKCICGNYNESKCFQCFKCKQKIHNCAKIQLNRPQIHSFECPGCLARSMDLIYQPVSILLETFYRFESIFQKENTINFEFDLKFEETIYPVDVRCFKGSKIELVWPMQGQFYLNGSKNPMFVLKPLKSNSNRKNRKEDNFLIKPQFLKQGKNVLTFKIPRLQKTKFIDSFQYQQTGIYYLAIYSVKELSNQQVLNITQKERRHQKQKTLALFRQGDQEVPTQKQKIRLIDPYTCERIKFPVRGRYCSHLSAVCLLTYISFQKRSRSWRCPICSVESNNFLNEPYLDIWLYEMLKQPTKSENVIIYANGMYEWEQVKKIEMNLDSDDEESEMRKQSESDRMIIQENPLIEALENFDLQSHPNPVDQVEQVNLIDFQSNEIGYMPDQAKMGEVVDHQIHSWNQNFTEKPHQVLEINHQINRIQLQNDSHPEPINSEVIAQEALEENIQSDSSQFQFPLDYDFVTASKLQNIKIPTTDQSQVSKKLTAAPEIYTNPLEKYPKTAENKPQPNSQKKIPMQVLDKMKQALVEKMKMKQPATKTSKQKKNVSINQPQSQKDNHMRNQQQKIDGDKRLISRPTFIQQMQQIKREQSLNAQIKKAQSLSFDKVKRKNIEFSQGKVQKVEPKVQHISRKLTNTMPSMKIPKKDQPISKPQKIKSIKCESISHNKFVKRYCNIPIPPLVRKMNEDMKRLFKNILELD